MAYGNAAALPDGTLIQMSISRKVCMESMWARKDREGHELVWTRSENSEQDLIVLWFCCHVPADWLAIGLYPIWMDGPQELPTYSALPLWQRYNDLVQTVMEWADASCLAQLSTAAVYDIAKQLWESSHANKAEPVEKKTAAGEVSPPESLPIGPGNTAASSPAETPAGPTT